MNSDIQHGEPLYGKWYALDACRYYMVIGKEMQYYKMYVTSIDEENDSFTYDSFIQVDGKIQASKIDKVGKLSELIAEIKSGQLNRKRSEIRPHLNDIGRKYGLNITMSITD